MRDEFDPATDAARVRKNRIVGAGIVAVCVVLITVGLMAK